MKILYNYQYKIIKLSIILLIVFNLLTFNKSIQYTYNPRFNSSYYTVYYHNECIGDDLQLFDALQLYIFGKFIF